MKKKAILLVNLGTPDKPTSRSVAKYLFQFLNDKFVIDIPWFFRILLVNLIIVPFRARKSAKLYQKLWTKDGSPLLVHLNNVVEKLQQKVSDEYIVMGAMRYGNPSIKNALKKLEKEGVEKIIVTPLFPQYATSTTESIKDFVSKIRKKSEQKYEVEYVEQFYDDPRFIEAFSNKIRSYHPENYNYILFSYHGLPENQVQAMHPNQKLATCNCTVKMPEHGKRCYKATCYETTRLITEKLSLPATRFGIAFQSRFSNKWLKPFFEDKIIELIKEDKKNILVIAPSFVADCLETKVEIEETYRDFFIKNGGENLILVESLNDENEWIEALLGIITHSQNN